MRLLWASAIILAVAFAFTTGQFFGYGRPAATYFGQTRYRQPVQPVQPAYGAYGSYGNCVPYPNYQSHKRNFWISWRDCGAHFRGDEISQVCASGGMLPVSLDDPHLADELMGLAGYEGQKYFWTGGFVSDGSFVSWPNGVTQSAYELAPLWSHTGGLGLPQPDNREGNEFCLAVLNNFYYDGIKLHDVACHHLKPIVCEA